MSADILAANVPRGRVAEGRDLNAGGAKCAAGPADRSSVASESKWAARLVCAGSLLTLVFQIAYLALDRRFLSTASALVAPASSAQYRAVSNRRNPDAQRGTVATPLLEACRILL